MFGAARSTLPLHDYTACTGCSLCLLVCPVWRKSRDVRLTPHGRAKALQHGALAADIAESIESCTLCGACEPACPESIDLVGMIVGLRRQLTPPAANAPLIPVAPSATTARRLLLAGRSLRERPQTLERVVELLGLAASGDDGADISFALETGGGVSPERVEQLLARLRGRTQIVVADGLLLRHLRAWLPRGPLVSLGGALSRLPSVRQRLRPSDLYVIEPRAYHADYERQVVHYDALRVETGCSINLDLQRIAMPAVARSLPERLGWIALDDAEQARWVIDGRDVSRIVVESVDDIEPLEQVADCPVVHIAHLADVSQVAGRS